MTWLRAHVETGKTSKDQVIAWFGRPLTDTSSSSTSIYSALMPDEIMCYSVKFSKEEGSGLSSYTDHWIKTVTFSIKGGVVVDYTVNQMSI